MGNSNNGFDKPVEPMTEQEISLVKECWDSIEDKQALGMAIMLRLVKYSLEPFPKKEKFNQLIKILNRLFLAHSEIKHKWIFAANLETEEEMLNNSQIKYHAKKIIDVFGKLVEGVVGHAELDNSSLERLGRNHFHYGVKVDDFVVSTKLNFLK